MPGETEYNSPGLGASEYRGEPGKTSFVDRAFSPYGIVAGGLNLGAAATGVAGLIGQGISGAVNGKTLGGNIASGLGLTDPGAEGKREIPAGTQQGYNVDGARPTFAGVGGLGYGSYNPSMNPTMNPTATPGYEGPKNQATGYSFIDQGPDNPMTGNAAFGGGGVGSLGYDSSKGEAWASVLNGESDINELGPVGRFDGGDTPMPSTTGGGGGGGGGGSFNPAATVATPTTPSTTPPNGAPPSWDEAGYLDANPDIAAAVAAGRWSSGYDFEQAFSKATGKSYAEAVAAGDTEALAYAEKILKLRPSEKLSRGPEVVPEPYKGMGIQSVYGMGPQHNYFPNRSFLRVNQGTAFAKGGLVQGPGTETSDSIPARINGDPRRPAEISDGEFIMTGKAVRGMGEGDRMEGARRLHSLMRKAERRV